MLCKWQMIYCTERCICYSTYLVFAWYTRLLSQFDSGCLRDNDVIWEFWCFKSPGTSLFQQLLKVNKKKTLKLRFTGLVKGGFPSQIDGNAWDIFKSWRPHFMAIFGGWFYSAAKIYTGAIPSIPNCCNSPHHLRNIDDIGCVGGEWVLI